VYRARVTLHEQSAAGGTGAVLLSTSLSTDEASLVASAREAYLRGDFPACVSMLERRTLADAGLRTEALFILARALMRLRRSGDVVQLLEPVLGTFSILDEICTARMLYGYAIAFAQDLDRGLELLAATALFANSEHVHRAIRAELSYYRAFAHWAKREYPEASRYAMEAESADLDVLSVRATELRAFISLATARYHEAIQLFNSARQAYAACRGRDIALATTIIYQVAFLEMNLRSATIRGTHADPESRTIPGTSFGPAVATSTRMLMASADAWLYALDGNRPMAVRKLSDAISFAPNSAWRVRALASGATISEAIRDVGHARYLADEAAALATAIDWNATTDEERIGLLLLAEVDAAVNPAAAKSVLALYDSVISRMDATRLLRDTDAEPRLAAWEAHVRGLVARALGEHERAAQLLRTAAELFKSCGYLWRAALSLIELDATLVDTSSDSPLEEAALLVRDNFPESFLADRLGRARIFVDPVARRLTPAQRDVLLHMLDGDSIATIAVETSRAVKTVRKHIEAVHSAFDTHSFAELLVECSRRGILSAATTIANEPIELPHTS
jgi:DNA-binding NarL/FixJ family response regulator